MTDNERSSPSAGPIWIAGVLAVAGGLSLSCTALAIPRGSGAVGSSALSEAANYLAVFAVCSGAAVVVAGVMLLAGRAGARGPLLVSAALMLSTFLPQFPTPPQGWVEIAWFWGAVALICLLLFPDARWWFKQPRIRRRDGREIPQMPLTVSVPLTMLWTGIAATLLFSPFPFDAAEALRASGMDGSGIARSQGLALVAAAWAGFLGFLCVSVARRSRVGLRLLIGAVAVGVLFQVFTLAFGPAIVGLPTSAGVDPVQAGIGFGSAALALTLLATPRSRRWCTESAWRAPLSAKREVARERKARQDWRRDKIREKAAEYSRAAEAERRNERALRRERWRRFAHRMPGILADAGSDLFTSSKQAARNAIRKERHLTEEGAAALMALGAAVVVVLLVVFGRSGQ